MLRDATCRQRRQILPRLSGINKDESRPGRPDMELHSKKQSAGSLNVMPRSTPSLIDARM